MRLQKNRFTPGRQGRREEKEWGCPLQGNWLYAATLFEYSEPFVNSKPARQFGPIQKTYRPRFAQVISNYVDVRPALA